MENVHVKQRLRPKRDAFIFPAQTFQLPLVLPAQTRPFGAGKGNTIIPAGDNEEFSGTIKELDPDELIVFDNVEVPQ
jgi:hypothetical protein